MYKKHQLSLKWFALLIPFFSTIILGCGTTAEKEYVPSSAQSAARQLPWTKEEENKMNMLPNIKNMELGIELPPNVQTDWKIETENGNRYVIFYQDPHKKGNPPYEPGNSPDVERLLYITNYGKKEGEDKFEGFWVTKVYEVDEGGVDKGVLFDMGAINYSENQTVSLLHIIKNKSSNQYEASITNYIVNGLRESKMDRWRKEGIMPIDVLLSSEGVKEEKLNFQSDIKVDADKASIKFYEGNLEKAVFEVIYQPKNDTLKVTTINASDTDKKNIFYNFTLNERPNILKKYSTKGDFSEFLSALIQLKIDEVQNAHTEDLGYRNLMLQFEHRKMISNK